MSLIDSIKQKLSNLTTLEIITAVGAPQLDERGHLKVTHGADSKLMFTQIRLLQGDVVTNVDESFVTGEYAELREFHQARVADGLQTVKDNIAALKQLYQLVTAIERDEPIDD
jgi:glutamate 5-kinase